MTPVAAVCAAVLLATSATACGNAGARRTEEIRAFAASSLTDAFTRLGRAFSKSTGVRVSFNFLGSSELATQIEQGAPADVFASADQVTMRRVVEAGLTNGSAEVFARNRLEIVVARGNPHEITNLQDLAHSSLVLALCDETVPAGQYARRALDKANVSVEPDSLEPQVRAVVGRVALGEADTGIVYHSDVVAGGDEVQGVPIPRRDNVVASYPIVTLKGAPAPAKRFVDLVLSGHGQRVLEDLGFQAP